MIEQIEEKYKNIIEHDKLFDYYFIVSIGGSVAVSLFLSFWYYIIVYAIALFILYLVILKKLKIKILSINALKISSNFQKFKKYKKDIRIKEIRKLLKKKLCLNKMDIDYLIKYYKNKTFKHYNIDWIYALISFGAPIIFGYFNNDIKNNQYVIYQLVSIIITLALFYAFYILFRKVFSSKDQRISMYKDIESILYELYFEVHK